MHAEALAAESCTPAANEDRQADVVISKGRTCSAEVSDAGQFSAGDKEAPPERSVTCESFGSGTARLASFAFKRVTP